VQLKIKAEIKYILQLCQFQSLFSVQSSQWISYKHSIIHTWLHRGFSHLCNYELCHSSMLCTRVVQKVLVLVLVETIFANTVKTIGRTNINAYFKSIAILWQWWKRYWRVLQY